MIRASWESRGSAAAPKLTVRAQFPELVVGASTDQILRAWGRNIVVYYQRCWQSGAHPADGALRPVDRKLERARKKIVGATDDGTTWNSEYPKAWKFRARKVPASKNTIRGMLPARTTFSPDPRAPRYYFSGLTAHTLRGQYQPARRRQLRNGQIVDLAGGVRFAVDASRADYARYSAGLDEQTLEAVASRVFPHRGPVSPSRAVEWEPLSAVARALQTAGSLLEATAGLVL